MRGGKVESGMAPREQGGSNLRGAAGDKSSVDTWEHAKPKGKWIKVSADCRVLEAATDEKREERDRDKLGDKLEALLTRKEEEDEATCLMEEMRKNVVAAQHKSFEAEQSLCNALREHVDGYDRDQDQARTLMTKCWKLMQSRDTKHSNLEQDLEDIQSTALRVGWCEEEKTARLWKQLGVTNKKPRSRESQPKMEGIVYLVAEWISLREMKALQSACMIVSIKAREKEYEEFLSDQDGQVWKEVSEEWQQYLMGKEESLAM